MREFIDIIETSGTGLWSNVIKENTEGTTAMACTISYHTLISYTAFQMSPVVQR